MDEPVPAIGPPPQIQPSSFRRRRRELAKRLGAGNTLVVATHPTHTYSNDVDYLFRPHSDFWYLTGFAEPQAVLVLQGGTGRTAMFLRERRKEAEIWTGRRLGVERAEEILGVDKAYGFSELASRLPDILGRDKVHALVNHDGAVQRRVSKAAGRHLVPEPVAPRPGGPKGAKPARKGKKTRDPPHGRALVHEMRLVKDAEEMRLLQKACDLGVDGHLRAAAAVRPGGREYQVEAAFGHHARHHGSTGNGYPSICGCGPNAAVLHYVTNQDALQKGETFLIDAGCEWGYYTSDITRTYPVGGRFSRVQERLYDLVLAAHKAALAKVRPGNTFRAPHEAAVDTITAGLIDLGYITGPFEAAVKEKRYTSYFMHGTSHWLGLDVHDAGGLNELDGSPRILREGMVLTVEPGLYFNPDYAACPSEAQSIGIRIEDDILVTADGRKNLTRKLPVSVDAVQDLLQDASRPQA